MDQPCEKPDFVATVNRGCAYYRCSYPPTGPSYSKRRTRSTPKCEERPTCLREAKGQPINRGKERDRQTDRQKQRETDRDTERDRETTHRDSSFLVGLETLGEATDRPTKELAQRRLHLPLSFEGSSIRLDGLEP